MRGATQVFKEELVAAFLAPKTFPAELLTTL